MVTKGSRKMKAIPKKKWHRFWIKPDELVKETKKYVFVQLKRVHGYESYTICHVKKLIRQTEQTNQILMLFTDDFQFYLKKYKDQNPSEEVLDTIQLTGKEFQQMNTK